jgi:hypothetical protein
MRRRSGICILHFQPVEKYPPVMNFINCLKEKTENFFVLTTKKNEHYNAFSAKNISIHRAGKQSSSSSKRYLTYIHFNIFSLLLLLLKRPGHLLCYETLSVFPAYWYKKLFPGTQVYLHFHEYYSVEEYSKFSGYVRFLYGLEKKLYDKLEWVSHTNTDRVNLFKNDHPGISQVSILSNYPPQKWYKKSKHRLNSNSEIKFVYIGALSLSSMFTEKFARWVHQNNGKVSWDIYTDNYSHDAISFLKGLNSPFIRLNNPVEYWAWPDILPTYDIGVVFYNGHIPNYIYNVPNKVFEYLSCGLQVWYSDSLKTCNTLLQTSLREYLKPISFNRDYISSLTRTAETFNQLDFSFEKFEPYSAEVEYKPLIEKLTRF